MQTPSVMCPAGGVWSEGLGLLKRSVKTVLSGTDGDSPTHPHAPLKQASPGVSLCSTAPEWGPDDRLSRGIQDEPRTSKASRVIDSREVSAHPQPFFFFFLLSSRLSLQLRPLAIERILIYLRPCISAGPEINEVVVLPRVDPLLRG